MHAETRRELPRTIGGLLAILVATVGIIVLVDLTNYDVWSSVITYGVLIAVTAPLLRYFARVDGDPVLYKILMWALVLKLGMAVPRYFMINVLYSGGGDASIYHAGAVSFANNIRAGNLTVDLGEFLANRPDETRRIATFTGVMYLITGPSIYSGFFIHSWFGFLGNLALTRGFRRGFPEGNQRRYTAVVMFLPSLMFWPSAIGKDGWMLMCLGVVGYGAGRLLGPAPSVVGGIPVLVGSIGAMWIRPHMGLIALLSLSVAVLCMVMRPAEGSHRKASSPAVRIGAVILVAGLVFYAASAVSQKFQGASTGLNTALDQTQIGGSAFESAAVRSPLDLPYATLSVLFRPFPWEARNLNTLIAASEGLLLAGLLVYHRRSLRSIAAYAWRRPYLIFCLAYTGTFIVAFSNIANAAILSRQRTQLMGLFLVVLAMPATKWWVERSGGDDVADVEPEVEVAATDDREPIAVSSSAVPAGGFSLSPRIVTWSDSGVGFPSNESTGVVS